jgi:hypothetical protein
MRTKMIICVMLTLLILLALSGLAAAQSFESPTYVPPPGPPPTVPPKDIPPTDGERMPTPPTSGGMAVGYNALIGMLLLGSALPLLRK